MRPSLGMSIFVLFLRRTSLVELESVFYPPDCINIKLYVGCEYFVLLN